MSAAEPTVLLRRDLRIITGEDGGFVLEDTRRGQYFRVGPREFAVLSQLDGTTKLADAIERAAQLTSTTPLDLGSLQTWLKATGLVKSPEADSESTSIDRGRVKALTRFNPCYFRYPVAVPVALQTQLAIMFGWLCSRPAIVVALWLGIVAAGLLLQDWQTFSTSLSRVLCPDQHLPLLGCWLLLKVVHELGHGVACRRLGGEVREWGLAFIYMMPVPYTDVTSSWRFSSRWERMAVAAAGMYFEWLMAILACGLWWAVENAMVRQWCAYTISLATVTTVLFNANPLCRMDGYYLLSDLLGWPNLAADGQKRAAEFGRRCLGLSANAEPVASRQRYWLGLGYGLASFVWRQVALVSMGLAVLWAYEGFGALMIAGVLGMWFWPANEATSSSRRPVWLRGPAIVRLVGAVAVVAAMLWYLPWPVPTIAPGVFESRERNVVRVRSAGHVAEIFVHDGEEVAAGTKLALLRNDQLTQELAGLEQTLAQGEARLRSLHTRKQMVDFQVEQQRQESVQAQLAECRRKVDSLTLLAPAAGRVTARRLADLPGSYLAEGTELCTIQGETMQFRLSLAERDLPRAAHWQGKPISIRVAGRTVTGVPTQFEPQASTTLLSEALGAAAGGPLPVTQAPAGTTTKANESPWRLVEPRITATVELTTPGNRELMNGQLGVARFPSRDETIAQVLVGWCQTRFLGK